MDGRGHQWDISCGIMINNQVPETADKIPRVTSNSLKAQRGIPKTQLSKSKCTF